MTINNSISSKQDVPDAPFIWNGSTEETEFFLLPPGYYEFETIGFNYSERNNSYTGGTYLCIELRLKIFHKDGDIVINCPMPAGSRLANSYFNAIDFPIGMEPSSSNTVGTRAGCRLAQKKVTVKTINVVEKFIKSNIN